MDNCQKCPVCGITKVDDTFYWSHKDMQGNLQEAKPDQVYSKVCGIARYHGRDTSECINKSGRFNKDYTWVELSKETTDALMFIENEANTP